MALVVGTAGSTAWAGPIDDLTAWLAKPADQRGEIDTQAFAKQPLTKAQAKQAADALWAERVARLKPQRQAEWQGKSITLDGKTMKFEYRVLGDKPATGRSLYISLHGGGSAPAKVNDQQWQNQIKLYTPAEGVYLAPRAPTDAWNMWHQDHIDPMFDRIIQDAVLFEGVNPDKVYVMGYSAGGDGVYQLAPRMADRWAAASMMAGHPGDASALSLRNLPFSIQVGANDAAYDRNKLGAEWGKKLDELRKQDPKGYDHFTEIHANKPHWMDREDAKAVPWMAKYTRNTRPERVVWVQDDVTHASFYWLAAPKDEQKAGVTMIAHVSGQTIEFEKGTTAHAVVLQLDDAIVDLDKPVKVVFQGKAIFDGMVQRRVGDLARSLEGRGDERLEFSAQVEAVLAK